MGSEKLIASDSYEEKSEKDKGNKYCTKFVLLWILGSFLIALIIGLCVQFLFPVVQRHYKTEDNVTIDVHFDDIPSSRKPPVKVQTTKPPVEVQTTESNDETWHLDFLINPTRLCDSWTDPQSDAYQKDPEVKLLVLVPSATGHFTQRMTIRKTWGAVAVKPHGPMRLGFILGTTPNATEEDMVLRESEIYGDIVQADFADTLRNLTTKSVFMLKWVSKYCPHAQYFLKTDDDTFVNLPILSKVLQRPEYGPGETFVGGYVQKGAVPIRTPTENYYVSEDDYPEVEYPPYASGSAYVTTGPTATKLFDATRRVSPLLPMEDVFVTGLCADEIGAKLLHEPTFHFNTPEDGSSWDAFSSLSTAHSVTPSDMDRVWEEMTKAITDAFNFSDSSSSSGSSWDSFGSISISDLFGWPKDKPMYGEESSDSDSSMSDSDSMKPPAIKSIFDIFNMIKEQVKGQMNWDLNELDPSPLNAKVDSRLLIFKNDQDIDEPLALPSRQINRGNLLQDQNLQKKINDTLNLFKKDDSSFSYTFYFKK